MNSEGNAAGTTLERTARLAPAVWVVALVFLVLHLLPQPGYGFHRDEFLYLAMGDHLDLFRMGFPPLIAVLAQAARALPGELLFAVRLLPALAGAALTILAALICRALGGRRLEQSFAACAVLAAPLFLRSATLFQPVVFEQLWWSIAVLALAKLLAGRDRRWWLAVGLGVGLGALTKASVAFFGAGLLVAILLSPLRRDLRSRWPWLALVVAGVLAVPSISGQTTWGWPFFEQASVLRSRQLVHYDRLGFFLNQFLPLGGGALLWLIGLLALLLAPALRPFRALGFLAGTIFFLLMAAGGKPYYFGPMQILLIAAAAAYAGAVLTGRWRPRVFGVGFAAIAFVGIPLVPMGVPLLPPPRMARYSAALGLTQATETNYGTVLPLPQDYADMTGWAEMVQTVADVFHSIPADEQAHTVIFGNNYGRTGAVALFGPGHGLPYPISRHGDFFFWGPGDRTGEVAIVLGGTSEQWEEFWSEVVLVGHSRNRWGVDEEQDMPIYLCRGPRQDMPTLFQRLGPYWG